VIIMMIKRSEWHNIVSPNTWHWFQASSKSAIVWTNQPC